MGRTERTRCHTWVICPDQVASRRRRYPLAGLPRAPFRFPNPPEHTLPDATLDHVAQARAIYADLRAMRMADMTKDQWNLFLALEPLFDPEIKQAREREEATVY